MEAFAALDIPKAYMTGYTERELVPVINRIVERGGYSHYIAISDDTVVRQRAVDAVMDLLHDHPIVTGWCNMDSTDARCGVIRTPLTTAVPTMESYDFIHWSEIALYPEPARQTWFAGMCLTGMSRDMWLKYPFQVYGDPQGPGSCSDYHLCWRLQRDGVPIVAARDGGVFHVKETWNQPDRAPDKRLRLGENVGVTFTD